MTEKRERENPVFYSWVMKVKEEDGSLNEIKQINEGKDPLLFREIVKNKKVEEIFLVPRTGKGVIIGMKVKETITPIYEQRGYHDNYSTIPEILVANLGFQYNSELLGTEDVIAYNNKLTYTAKLFVYPNGTIEFGATQPSFNTQYQMNRSVISGGFYDFRICIP